MERRASHMQREARREETKRERREGEEGTEVSPDTSVCLSMAVLEPKDRARPQCQPIINPCEPQGARAALAGLQNRKGSGAPSPWDKSAGFHESWRKLQTAPSGSLAHLQHPQGRCSHTGRVSILPHPKAKTLLGLHSQEDTLSPLDLLAQGTPHRLGVGTSWPSPAVVWGSERGPQEQPLLQHSTWSGNIHINRDKRHWEEVGGIPPLDNG